MTNVFSSLSVASKPEDFCIISLPDDSSKKIVARLGFSKDESKPVCGMESRVLWNMLYSKRKIPMYLLEKILLNKTYKEAMILLQNTDEDLISLGMEEKPKQVVALDPVPIVEEKKQIVTPAPFRAQASNAIEKSHWDAKKFHQEVAKFFGQPTVFPILMPRRHFLGKEMSQLMQSAQGSSRIKKIDPALTDENYPLNPFGPLPAKRYKGYLYPPLVRGAYTSFRELFSQNPLFVASGLHGLVYARQNCAQYFPPGLIFPMALQSQLWKNSNGIHCVPTLEIWVDNTEEWQKKYLEGLLLEPKDTYIFTMERDVLPV
jgi:hypothetical protein